MTTKTWPFAASSVPYVKGSETSKAAAESIKHRSQSDKMKVFQFLIHCGENGATDDEIESALNMKHQTASARRRQLELIGAVEKTTEKRKTRSGRSAFVYRANPTADPNTKVGRPVKSEQDLRKIKATTYLTREQYADLCMMAAERDVSVADLIRTVIKSFIAENQ